MVGRNQVAPLGMGAYSHYYRYTRPCLGLDGNNRIATIHVSRSPVVAGTTTLTTHSDTSENWQGDMTTSHDEPYNHGHHYYYPDKVTLQQETRSDVVVDETTIETSKNPQDDDDNNDEYKYVDREHKETASHESCNGDCTMAQTKDAPSPNKDPQPVFPTATTTITTTTTTTTKNKTRKGPGWWRKLKALVSRRKMSNDKTRGRNFLRVRFFLGVAPIVLIEQPHERTFLQDALRKT